MLCPTCAFRVFAEVRASPLVAWPLLPQCLLTPDVSAAPQDRRCPSCRSAMLFPLVLKADVSTEPFSPDVATTALRYAEEAVSAAVGNAQGVLQSLVDGSGSLLPLREPQLRSLLKAAAKIRLIQRSCRRQCEDPRAALMRVLVKAPQPFSATGPSGKLLRALEVRSLPHRPCALM